MQGDSKIKSHNSNILKLNTKIMWFGISQGSPIRSTVSSFVPYFHLVQHPHKKTIITVFLALRCYKKVQTSKPRNENKFRTLLYNNGFRLFGNPRATIWHIWCEKTHVYVFLQLLKDGPGRHKNTSCHKYNFPNPTPDKYIEDLVTQR